jgi:hypothetical protein
MEAVPASHARNEGEGDFFNPEVRSIRGLALLHHAAAVGLALAPGTPRDGATLLVRTEVTVVPATGEPAGASMTIDHISTAGMKCTLGYFIAH